MNRSICAAIACLAILSSGISAAQEGDEAEAEEDFRGEAGAYAQYAPETFYTGWEYSYEHKILDKLPVTFTIGSDAMFIYKQTALSLPAHLVSFTADAETILPIFGLKGFYAGGGVTPSFYSDGWAFEASSFRLPCRSFLIYQPDDKWTLVGGIAVFPKLKYPVWPVFGVIYKPVKELEFNLLSENPNVVYHLNDRISLFAEGDFTYDEYEVDRGAARNVALRYEDGFAGGGIEFSFTKFARVSVTAGGIFERSLKYSDGAGKADVKGGFYTQVELTAAF